ncbi:non-ribosomal peptide synthetase [Actinophytocola glycyrrhizae]|uniref:Amino acid adenylation domain-containing protein n=1 Tax=Actinophytocola glycyrrhizae TaxID=2044873 RepID=A0ABV9RXS7_9PSEU
MTDRDRLLARLLAQRGIELAGQPQIPRRDPGDTVPLSGAQRGLWFTERMGLDQGAYVMPMVARLTGDLDVPALRDAMRAVLARHEALRTYVVDRDGVPEQRVAPSVADEDWFTLVEEPGEPDAVLAEAVDRPFDLERAPFVRLLLIRHSPVEHTMLLAAHHIVCDDTSIHQLYAELVTLYAGGELPPLDLHFPDYVRWQENHLDAGARDRQLAYWKGTLADAPPVLDLPTDRPRTAARGVAGASHTFAVPADLATRFGELCRAHGCTTFAGLLAAFGLLLGRYASTTDVVIGSPTTRRPSQMDGVVGLFVNPTALRVDLSGAPTVPELLTRARDVAAAALGNADVSFDQVAAALAPRRDLSYHPLFQVMLVQNRGGDPVAWPELTAEGVEVGRATSRFDLTLHVRERAGSWPVNLDYSAELFDHGTMTRFGTHFVAMLTAMVEHPDAPVTTLDLSTVDDRALLARLNEATATYPFVDSVVDLIEAQARRTPDATAVMTVSGAALSYRELDERANALAASLRGQGVGQETPVGLRLRASPHAIVGLLAILKAGGYYVPLDPGWPALRLRTILDDCGATVVLSEEDLPFTATAAAPPELPRHPSGLAYAVYTSGSTGAPKGVGVQHDSLLNLTCAFVERHGFAAGQKLLMVPPLSFDASVGDVFPALAVGMTLVLHPEPAALGGAELLRLCAEHDITAVDTAAALWRRWVGDLTGLDEAAQDSPLRVMMVGGEAVPASAVREWAVLTGGRVTLHNHYGPTEGTVCATTFSTVDGPGTDGALPIGRPLPNVRTYVLDADLRPAPVGVPGELFVGGAAPARGYLSSPGGTAAAFLPDPFTPGRMYRTGDLARLRPDGTLEFLGRADEQVKLRGNRIELAEVRTALAAHPQAAEVAVAVRDDVLVGYLVPRTGATLPGPVELRAFCADRLPDYMLPAAFVVLDELPLTRNGKVDAGALPAPASSAAPHEAPRTPVEKVLAEVWGEVLANPAVGRRDNFLTLGGHSLLAPAILAKVRSLLGVTLPLRSVFATGDLSELAEVVEQARVSDGEFARNYTQGIPSVEQLRLDAEPPADIRPTAPPAEGPVKRVLLTGATGFLGAHLLAELLGRTEADVYCLVRAESPAVARARLLANLRRARLTVPDADLDRIVPVVGDMAEPRLGLSIPDYRMLCDTMDAIYHNGVVMNFVLTYQWLMPPHVESTIEILRLAIRGRTKPLHLMSTLGVFLGRNYDRQLVTEDDRALDPSGLDTGYHTTKWVADTMGVNARDRGLPISIYRIAAIVGDVATGTAKTDSYLSRQVATCAHQGSVPVSHDVIDMLPVDRIAAAIVGISQRHTGRDFHFYRADGYTYPDLGVTLNEMGYPVETLPYEEWRQRMLAAPSSSFGPLAFGLPTWRRPHPVFDCSKTWAAAREAGVEFPPADAAMMRRHIRFLAESGVLPEEVAVDADRVG